MKYLPYFCVGAICTVLIKDFTQCMICVLLFPIILSAILDKDKT